MKRLDTQEFIRRAHEVHGDKYDYSQVDYSSVREKVTIICPHHGPFEQSYELHIRRKNGCNACGQESQRKKKAVSVKQYIQRAMDRHSDRYEYPNITLANNLRTVINIRCPDHGIFQHMAYSHLHDGRGCPSCAKEAHRLTTAEFIENGRKLFGDFYDYSNSEYRTVHDLVIIGCPHHGQIEIAPKDHYRVGCFQCKKNRLEDLWLDSMGVPNDGTSRQVSITIGERKLVVDGFDGHNTVFLFHGDFWHGNPMVYDPNDINPRNQKRFGELYLETLDYEQTLRDAGYDVVVEWEKEWYDKNDDTKDRKKKRRR